MNRGSELVRQQILRLMAENHISKAELARRIGEKPLWIQKRLSPTADNKATITADEVPLFASALGVSVLDLYADVLSAEQPPKSPIARNVTKPLQSPRYTEEETGSDESAPSPEYIGEGPSIEDEFEEEFNRELAAMSPTERSTIRRLAKVLDRLTQAPDDEGHDKLAG